MDNRNVVKGLHVIPGEPSTLGDRLILNALRRKVEALEAFESDPNRDTLRKFLDTVDHMNYLGSQV